MYKAFGWAHPEFCHLPMVMGQDGKKLSKRHGSTGIDEFKRQGCLPEALINYVALVGASYEEGKELYTLEELVERFSLEKLCKAPAVFDYKKLEWYNGLYIRMKSDEELARLCLPFAVAAGLFADTGSAAPSPEQLRGFKAAMPLIKERISFLSEAPEKLAYLFKEPTLPDAQEFIPKKHDLAQTIKLLLLGRELVKPLAEAEDDGQAESFIKGEAEKNAVKLGDLMMPLRVAVTGSRVSPPLFGSLRILGAERSLSRVQKALDLLAAI
jgi:glutamyl-tRNA synthetase